MALTIASSASVMHDLDRRFNVQSTNAFFFTFPKLHKSWSERKHLPIAHFHKYTGNQELHVVSTNRTLP